MGGMVVRTLLLVGLLAGLPWLRSSETMPETAPAAPPTGSTPATSASRIEVLALDSDAYRALAIPRSYKSDVEASTRLLVFRDGLCVRDRGLITSHKTQNGGDTRSIVMEETGITERAVVASDERTAIVASTRYVSRVDVTPGTTSTKNDTIRGATTLTLVDPAHPDGRWRVTLEEARWVQDVIVLPAGAGAAITTFLPRTGPSDLRLLDASGRERLRVPESAAETLRLEASPDGGFVAAELAFPEGGTWERAVMVVAADGATQWTYGWRYGDDKEPTDWGLERGGILTVRLASGVRRFDSTGRRR